MEITYFVLNFCKRKENKKLYLIKIDYSIQILSFYKYIWKSKNVKM